MEQGRATVVRPKRQYPEEEVPRYQHHLMIGQYSNIVIERILVQLSEFSARFGSRPEFTEQPILIPVVAFSKLFYILEQRASRTR